MLIPRVHTCYCSAWIQQHRGSIASRLVGLALSATFVIWVAAWHFIDSEKATTLQRPHNLVKSYIEDGRGDGGRESPISPESLSSTDYNGQDGIYLANG